MQRKAELNPRALRHRWEMPMVVLSAILSVLALLAAIFFPAIEQAVLVDLFAADERAALRDLVSYGWVLLVAPFLMFIMRYWMAAGARANAVKVGPDQFSELWTMYGNLAARIGVDPLPRFYVTNGNGVVNAYALSCNRRNKYVVIHAEIACLVKSHPRIVEFVLAHELSHHRLGHTSLWRGVIGAVPGALFLPGQALTRAQEYSADRLAFHHCPDCIDGVSFLGVGPWMAGEVKEEPMMAQAEEDDRSPLIRLHNIMSSHAVLPKRFKALKDMERYGIGRHGQMF